MRKLSPCKESRYCFARGLDAFFAVVSLKSQITRTMASEDTTAPIPDATEVIKEETEVAAVPSEIKTDESEKPASTSTEAKATPTEKSSETGEKEVKLYIGNLPDECLGEKLKELFDKYGNVTQCDKVKNFAFVHMLGEQAAKDAVAALDDKEFMGTHLQVQFARSKGKPSEDECFECGKHGHWARDCSRRRSRYERNRYQPYDRYDRPPPRRPYDYPPPPGGRYYDDYYYDRRPAPPSRDPYYSQGSYGYSYRSRSPPPRSPPRFSGCYEGYPRSAYEGRRY